MLWFNRSNLNGFVEWAWLHDDGAGRGGVILGFHNQGVRPNPAAPQPQTIPLLFQESRRGMLKNIQVRRKK